MADKIEAHMALVKKLAGHVGSKEAVGALKAFDAIEASARALAQGEPGEPLARILHWNGAKHMYVPHGGICARTFAEFPKGAGENGGYWKEGAPLYLSPTASAPAVAQGYALVSIDQLKDWKSMANTVAILSTKKDRFAYGAALKQEIADVINDPANLTEVAPTHIQPHDPVTVKGGPAE